MIKRKAGVWAQNEAACHGLCSPRDGHMHQLERAGRLWWIILLPPGCHCCGMGGDVSLAGNSTLLWVRSWQKHEAHAPVRWRQPGFISWQAQVKQQLCPP